MPLNLIKTYSAFLEFIGLNESQRRDSLIRIFKRDIEDNPSFTFRDKAIRPLKIEGDAMKTLFSHLTCLSEMVEESGQKFKKRDTFDIERSKRLHWIKYHIEEKEPSVIVVFSAEERINGRNTIRTYVYDKVQKYVIVLEPQRSGRDYYLITAYYLNEPYGIKAMKKRIQKKLENLY